MLGDRNPRIPMSSCGTGSLNPTHNWVKSMKGYPRSAPQSSHVKAILCVLTIAAVTVVGSNALAYDSLFKQGCSIEHKDYKSPINTDCDVRSSISQGALYQTVKIPDGRTFTISGDYNTDKWLLNGKEARRTTSVANECFENSDIQICFE